MCNCFSMEIGDGSTPHDVKKKWTRICRCSVGWLLIGVLAVVVGILFMVFFVQYWNDTTNWQRGLGYAGVALLCLGLLIFLVGIGLACVLCYIVRTIEHKRHYKPQVWGPEIKYPRQAQSAPSAPPPEEGHHNAATDIEAVEPEIKDKTF